MAMRPHKASRPRPAPPATPPSHRKRRLLYGLNVTIAVFAAVALVVLVNGIVDWQYRRLSPALKDLVRFDLTATRAYTLAPQTRQTLAGLDQPHRVVAVLRINDRRGQDVADLLAEYARYGRNVTVEFIDPDRELDRLEAFYRSLEERLAGETAAMRKAVDQGLVAIGELADALASLRQRFAAVAGDASVEDDEATSQLRLFDTKLREIEAAYRSARSTLEASLAGPLPPLSNARADLLGALQKAEREVLAPYQREFARRAQDRGTPMAVRDILLRVDGPMAEMRSALVPQIDALTRPAEPARYNRVLELLRAGEVVVVLSDESERVLPVTELFAAGGADASGNAGPAVFVGEDRLTGALVTMGVAQPPRVIFIHDGPASVLTPQGGFAYGVGRLLTTDFEVGEWWLGGEGASTSGQGSAAPPPDAKPGQATVWIVPALSLDRTTVSDREQVAGHLRRRLERGDGVLLSFTYDPEALYRPADPLAALSGDWGLVPQMHELLLHEGLGGDGLPRAEASWRVTRWPPGSPLSSALAGREAQFVAVSPLRLEPRPRIDSRPLVVLEAERVWATAGLTSPEQIAASRYSAEKAVERPIIAAAAWGDRDDDGRPDPEAGRLAVFTERHWLSDRQASRLLGNSELFIHAVNWLAGLDEAIAATPRSQDVRRVGAMSESTQLVYRLVLLAGVPLLALGSGVVVWTVRRRG